MLDVRIDTYSSHSIRYQAAPLGGGTTTYELPIAVGSARGLHANVAAIVLTADLQGEVDVAAGNTSRQLLGETLANELAAMSAAGVIPPAEDTGVILAGDFYSDAQGRGRGACGDVRPVWNAFREKFKWVVGVAGNHDEFGPYGEMAHSHATDGADLLDGSFVDVDGLRIAGVGGIIGSPPRLNHKTEGDFLRAAGTLLRMGPDLLVTHQGPDLPDAGFKGSAAYRALLEDSIRTTAVFGHCEWPEPLMSLPNGTQLLCAAGRAVVLVNTTTGT